MTITLTLWSVMAFACDVYCYGTPVESPRCVALGDLNDDGTMDVLIGGVSASAWLANDGDGLFSGAQSVNTDGTSCLLVDLNNDGQLDALFGAYDELRVVMGTASGFRTGSAAYATQVTRPLGVADIDGVGGVDLLTVGSGELEWRSGDGTGGFGDGQAVGTSPQGFSTGAAGDVDGDGNIDVVAGTENGEVLWFRNAGGGSFEAARQVRRANGEWVHGVTVADLDGDGDADILYSRPQALDALVNDGAESFSVEVKANGSVSNVVDLDGDGDLDLVVNSPLAWMENDGSWTFITHPIGNFEYPKGVVTGDVDGDGDSDIVTFEYDGWVRWYEKKTGTSVVEFPTPISEQQCGGCDSGDTGPRDAPGTPDADSKGGCGCSSTSPTGGWVLLAMGFCVQMIRRCRR